MAIAIIQDLQGPRIRVGEVNQDGLDLVAGETVRLVTTLFRSGGQLGARSTAPSAMHEIPVTYQYLVRDVRPGVRILIDDGLIELMTDRITERCRRMQSRDRGATHLAQGHELT